MCISKYVCALVCYICDYHLELKKWEGNIDSVYYTNAVGWLIDLDCEIFKLGLHNTYSSKCYVSEYKLVLWLDSCFY